MKRIMALAAALAAAVPAAAAERSYSVADFDRVQVEGPYQVVITTGLSSGARAIGDSAAIDRVSVEVQGRTLRVRPNRSAWGGYPGDKVGPVRIEARTRDVRSAGVAGSGTLSVDRAKGLRVDLSVSGSGRLIVGTLDADTLIVGLLGSGRITAAGKAKTVRATVQGTGDFDGRGLRADDVEMLADTSGIVAVEAARTAKVTAVGSGDVEILGAPSCTVSGPAEALVKCGRPR